MGSTLRKPVNLPIMQVLENEPSLSEFFNYNPDTDNTEMSALLAAQMAWHFIEGYSKRKNVPKTLNTPDYLKFIVGTGTSGVDMVFYCDEALDRWWMEIPISLKWAFHQ